MSHHHICCLCAEDFECEVQDQDCEADEKTIMCDECADKEDFPELYEDEPEQEES